MVIALTSIWSLDTIDEQSRALEIIRIVIVTDADHTCIQAADHTCIQAADHTCI